MVAGEHGPLTDEGKAEMVGSVAGRVQNVERDVAGLHHVTVGDASIRRERRIDERISKPGRRRAAQATGWAKAQDLAAEQILQRPRAVAMIAMAMRDEDTGDSLPAHRSGDCGEMALVSGTRIDQGDIAAPDEIGVGTAKRVGARVRRDDA